MVWSEDGGASRDGSRGKVNGDFLKPGVKLSKVRTGKL